MISTLFYRMWFPFFWSCHSDPLYIGPPTMLIPYHKLNGKSATFLGHEASLVSNSICSLLVQKDEVVQFWASYVMEGKVLNCVAAYSVSVKFTLKALDYAVVNYETVKLHLSCKVEERHIFSLLWHRYSMCDENQNPIVDLDGHTCVFLSRRMNSKSEYDRK